MGSAQAFAAQIDIEFDGALDELRTVIRQIALEATRRIVLRTPVKDGGARGNWQVAIGGAGGDTLERLDPSGGAAVSAAAGALAAYAAVEGFPVIAIYNNLPYINRLETGYSDQAPAGMVAVTVAEFQGLQ